MAYSSCSWSLSLALLYIFYINNWIMRYAKKSQNKAKRPNIFFKAKQEMKKPKLSYLAAKKPSYQPWEFRVVVMKT